MGIVTSGIPEQITIDLAKAHGASVFIETGTYQGSTTRWASRHFPIVHTVERAPNLYDLHHQELAQLDGVTPHLGDSRDVLPQILKAIPDQKAVVWLDGHWSGGNTAGEGDECPVLKELASLASRPDDIILIDDARLFLCAPPAPHNPKQWPTLVDIIDALQRPHDKYFFQIVDDVIFIVPNVEALKSTLTKYAQERSGSFWNAFLRQPDRKKSFLTSLFKVSAN